MNEANTARRKPAPSLSSLIADVELSFDIPANESKYKFDPLIAGLCDGIRKHGTLAEAAKEMKISYSHAWSTVDAFEKENGVQIIFRDKPRGCWLSPLGNKLLDGYLELKEDLSSYAEEYYVEIFGAMSST